MILSVRHKFVFIKGMKVAGTSVEMALAPLCGPADIVTPISPIDELARIQRGGRAQNYSTSRALEADWLQKIAQATPAELETIPQPPPVFYNHMSLFEVLNKFPQPLTGFKLIGIERSPYAKVISWANMRLTYGQYRDGSGEMRADAEHIRNYLDQSFENGRVLDCRNIDRYRGADGKIAVTPMRYATLQADFDAFVQGIGMATPPLPHAKKGLLSDTLDPRNILRPDQISRINSLFGEEFDAFAYERL
jgi:hypothetical protein